MNVKQVSVYTIQNVKQVSVYTIHVPVMNRILQINL